MKKRFKYFLVLAVLLLVFAAGGCETESEDVQEEGTTETEDVQETVSIDIRGSDSEVNLVQSMAEAYMEDNSHVRISVTGGGSGVGISSLIDGDCDIANSSRPMSDEEIANCTERQGEPYAVRFAVDGVAVIINENNPVNDLSVEDLGKIFRGETKDWSEVGGSDGAINLYGRQSTSGTYVFFMESVLEGDYADTMMNMAGNADIVEAIKNDVTAIGYVAIGYAVEGSSVAPGLKVLEVSATPGATPYSPIELANITSGNYPITRPLYQFVVGKPSGAVLDFLQFEVSDAGRDIVLSEGFYPITEEDIEFNKKALN